MVLNKIEELYFDKTKKSVSSQSIIKSGPNRGFRFPEKNGQWICMSGFNHSARQTEKFSHFEWANSLIKLGFRIGKTNNNGETYFYLFKENSK